ncbi:MAG: DUF4445 domain-containing protein [Lachnospiraceae bacterium]|nr:DUF4445 domain-containing protein [Lachnospiraceae bacterium]
MTADIGTTTIAMQLHKENGEVEDSYVAVNPQSVYGADVLSRIHAASSSYASAQKQGPAIIMQEMVVDVLRKGICRFQGHLKDGEGLQMILAGNTTMIYLLMGWNPEELGRAPFHASHLEAVETVIAGVDTVILPGLSAFVGGDIVAGIWATKMLLSKDLVLLIDLGTNGEMVLGNKNRLIACATAAGPAFEGGVNRGIWGADMVSILAAMIREGIIDKEGLLMEEYFEKGVRVGNVCVTQEAVRALQLAKAAIAAGIEILLQEYGCDMDSVSQVVLAGGFGYYLNPSDAAQIGLLPRELSEKTISGGNTVLTGALYIGERHLGCTGGAKLAEWLKETNARTEVINLANHPEFAEKYIKSISFKE